MSTRVECPEGEDGVALVTIDRPKRHNAIDLETAAELAAAWRAIRMDDRIRAVVLTGAGDQAFCTASTGRSRCRSPRPRTRSTIRS